MLEKFGVCLLLLATFCGCSGGETFPTGEITGEVKRMNGEPFGDVSVVFYPEKGTSTVAKTDAAGRFTADVALGKARVAVVPPMQGITSDNSPKAIAELKKHKPTIKPQYSSPDTSNLTVDVGKEQKEKLVFVVE